MQRVRKQPVLVGLQEAFPQARFFHLDRRDLDYIVNVLNWKPPGGRSLYGEPLVRLMERLKEHGGNLKKMMDGDSALAKLVEKVCVTRSVPLENGRARLVLQPNWQYILEHKLTPNQADRLRPERYAALLFHVGTLNPEWEKLAGPCGRCGRYYLKRRASQKVYCSRGCGNAATAVARTRARLDQEHANKLDRAQAAMQKWTSSRTKDDWKAFVSKREPEITPKFLTRAVNNGELKVPKKGR
jgi:hypothetical protein